MRLDSQPNILRLACPVSRCPMLSHTQRIGDSTAKTGRRKIRPFVRTTDRRGQEVPRPESGNRFHHQVAVFAVVVIRGDLLGDDVAVLVVEPLGGRVAHADFEDGRCDPLCLQY